MTVLLTESQTTTSTKFYARVRGADPLTLDRRDPQGRVLSIDPTSVQVSWNDWHGKSAPGLGISVTGKVYNRNGAVGLRTNTRTWHLIQGSPSVGREVPRWIWDILDHQVAHGIAPDWGVEIWKEQTP